MDKFALIVDDNEKKVSDLIYYLEAEGYKTKQIYELKPAIEFIKTNTDNITLIFLDLCIPFFPNKIFSEVEGLKLIDKLQDLKINIPVIVFSSTPIPKSYDDKILMHISPEDWPYKLPEVLNKLKLH